MARQRRMTVGVASGTWTAKVDRHHRQQEQWRSSLGSHGWQYDHQQYGQQPEGIVISNMANSKRIDRNMTSSKMFINAPNDLVLKCSYHLGTGYLHCFWKRIPLRGLSPGEQLPEFGGYNRESQSPSVSASNNRAQLEGNHESS